MKLCVFSDSHGRPENMLSALAREAPELCFFLGDGDRDLAVLEARYPRLPILAVRGNCDLRSRRSVSLVCAAGGVRFFLCHGHLQNVKYEPGLETLSAAAREQGAAAALFGHTHVQTLRRREGLLLFNPGSIGRAAPPAYGVLWAEGGVLRGELKTL